MKNTFNLKLSKLNSFFGRKNNLLIYLILFLGVMIPTFSGSFDNNLWLRLYTILNNSIFNAMFFLVISLNVINMMGDFSKSFNIINRHSNYKQLIKTFIHDIILYTFYLSIVSLILAFAGAIIFSFGNFKMALHPIYQIPMIYYLVFFILRSCLFGCVVNVIIYLLFTVLNKFFATILILFNSAFFMIVPNNYGVIVHFYNMPLLYSYYYEKITYSSFFLEIICSILELFLLYFIYKLILYFITLKKRDLV